MISSASSPDRAARPDAPAAAGPAGPRPSLPRPDHLSTEGVAHLRAALVRHPEVRPEVVARARALAADPAWPPVEIMSRIARQILLSPDLSEDQA